MFECVCELESSNSLLLLNISLQFDHQMFKAHPLSALVLPAPVDLQREAHFQMVQTARFSLAD